MNTRKMRNTKGITLVALIVTIIVLLILAGISLNLILGEKGITQRAVNAGKTHNIAGAKEKLELQIADYAGEYYQAKYVNRSVEASDVGTYVLGKFSPEETTFEENYYLKKENSKLILTSSDRTTTATCTVDSNGKVVWEGTEIDNDTSQTTYTWTQYAEEGETAKIWVTNGDVTLEVGSSISGYSVTVDGTTYGDGNWYVLGAKDGKLLITTKTSVDTCISLSGRDGYTNGIVALNTAAANYTNSTYADGNARTINIDDINRVTGYDPTTYGTGLLNEYGNQVTYYWQGTDYPYYSSSNGLMGSSDDHEGAFYYPTANGFTNSVFSSNATTENREEITTLTSTHYEYNGSSEIDSSILAYTLLFANTGNFPADNGSYWIGSQFVNCQTDFAWFGVRCVWGGCVDDYGLCSSEHYSGGGAGIYLRPVVSLKSSVKVTSEGVISNN